MLERKPYDKRAVACVALGLPLWYEDGEEEKAEEEAEEEEGIPQR